MGFPEEFTFIGQYVFMTKAEGHNKCMCLITAPITTLLLHLDVNPESADTQTHTQHANPEPSSSPLSYVCCLLLPNNLLVTHIYICTQIRPATNTAGVLGCTCMCNPHAFI